MVMKTRTQKSPKKCVIKRFENYKHCLEATQIENEINQRKIGKSI